MCSSSRSNPTPVSSCMFSDPWTDHNEDVVDIQDNSSWVVREADDFYTDHVTASAAEADGTQNEDTKDEHEDGERDFSKPLREKNAKKNIGYKHVPHKDKPPQIVAKRNARERRRVQAVNSAFLRLRRAVPIENTRGKRVSKVKTLQNAIQYIKKLQLLLQQTDCCSINESFDFQGIARSHCEFFEEFYFKEEF